MPYIGWAKGMMMLRWVRFLISVFALAATLAGGIGGASAASSHHHCPAMTMADGAVGHGPCDGNDGAAPPCNEMAFCAAQQTLLPPHSTVLPRTFLSQAVPPLRDYVRRPGLSSPPDLRPPIA